MKNEIRYCPPCATGSHNHCQGDVPTRPSAKCECGSREHDPAVEVAAQMAIYVWGAHAMTRSPESAATSWRKAYGINRVPRQKKYFTSITPGVEVEEFYGEVPPPAGPGETIPIDGEELEVHLALPAAG